jgi:hypothetical protein
MRTSPIAEDPGRGHGWVVEFRRHYHGLAGVAGRCIEHRLAAMVSIAARIVLISTPPIPARSAASWHRAG